MPRPRSLDHAAIAAAAIAVIDRDGLAALTMRSVADEIGVSAMALYRYVEGREELERLVVDRVLAIDLALPPRAAWQRALTILVERVRAAIGAHPAIVPLTLTHRHRSEGLQRFGEAVLGVLSGAGFSGARRVIAFRCLLAYVIGNLQAGSLAPLMGEGTVVLAGLSVSDVPHLSETARDARRVTADREFLGGLRILLRGLERDA